MQISGAVREVNAAVCVRRRTLLTGITVCDRTTNQQISSNFHQLCLTVHFMSNVVMPEGSDRRQTRGLRQVSRQLKHWERQCYLR